MKHHAPANEERTELLICLPCLPLHWYWLTLQALLLHVWLLDWVAGWGLF